MLIQFAGIIAVTESTALSGVQKCVQTPSPTGEAFTPLGPFKKSKGPFWEGREV